jgi:hypothetical protein
MQSQTSLIAELKFRAVVQYLQGILGTRYKGYDKLVTPEFAEKYILDYKVGRLATDKNQLEVSGHLDSDALKRWVRLTEIKTRGSSVLKPAIIVSTTSDNFRGREGALAEKIGALFNKDLQKYNVKFTPLKVGISAPPKSDSELKSLRDAVASYNLALWVHLSPCKGCRGMKSDIYLYNLPQSRILLAHTDELSLDPKDAANVEKVKHAFGSAAKQFDSEFEALVSSGELFSAVYYLTVEGIEDYRTYKSVEAELNRLDFLSRASLVRAEHAQKLAEFELASQLPLEELKESLKQADFSRSNLKITVR